ncbi:hypothetical protein BN2476_200073 [Paraburkholderia piptadeniae]|uniref:Uncharacterized protein n=1 Tax=Paraburkholderia piptadeniae TaxID=1701573 RepID=A0A1N7RV07_9BURK|nr:hypothetical protein BN2476_200073 [Paraburkholderia piptadeniae]
MFRERNPSAEGLFQPIGIFAIQRALPNACKIDNPFGMAVHCCAACSRHCFQLLHPPLRGRQPDR